ncbi:MULTISPECIES: hypothetical protein [Maribacter]|jgi:hypothetical protein|uniref:Uncharacterized protein n=1 Tax=Maribacter stanieri TaxID=440514 RepID=A0A1I6HRV4_9FLAO|nr:MULTISPECIES: hypothetical protein [Maribacter]SFR57196.1 hypothetical protein SAMN04488010_0662 [Maribacter stanieri]|tara:strand:+ start:276 stop:446 length:171 start_codon:yes stop_codon:yes gene_type:complete
MKENTEETKFVKEPEEDTREYILQKNKKTKLGVTILTAFLVLLIIGIIISNVFFNN